MTTCKAPALDFCCVVLLDLPQTLIDLHGSDEGLGGKLTDDEVQIICGTYLKPSSTYIHPMHIMLQKLHLLVTSCGQLQSACVAPRCS
jgi:hypothetical protein